MNFIIAGGFNFKKPRLFVKLARSYINSFINPYPLRTMGIAVDYSCNFNCQHCSADSLKNPNVQSLSLKEYEEIAKDAIKMGISYFVFTGGEPLLRNDLFEIIKIFKPKENLISIQTNGWCVDETFFNNYIKIGGDIISISLDSIDPDIHDKFRGKSGSWEKAVRAIKMGKQKRLRTLISYTLTHDNLKNGDFNSMIKFSKDLNVFLSVVLASPAGKWRGKFNHLLNNHDRIILDRLLIKYPHVRTDSNNTWKGKGCPALKEVLYLTPYGDVLPCPFVQISLGNAREKPLMEIYSRALNSSYLTKGHSVCIAAEDKYFIEKAGCYGKEFSSLPIKHSDSAILN